jgi:hypothetical protein
VITALGEYTPGCIRIQNGEKTVVDQAAIDDAYRFDDKFLTRSYAHSVFRHGGVGQESLDNGESLFSGNSATDFGTLVDRAIPLLVCGRDLESHYAVAPEAVLANGARRGKVYAEWKAGLGGKLEISQPDWHRLTRICKNVMAHPANRAILEATDDCQAAIRWTDAEGHARKLLADGQTPDFLWDFKTTSSDWKSLHRSCLDYGYLWQDAWYEAGAIACGWEPHRLRFLFAQTVRPFAVRVYTMPEDLVARARDQIRVTLGQIALRRELGLYRGPEDVETLELDFPAWTRGGER